MKFPVQFKSICPIVSLLWVFLSIASAENRVVFTYTIDYLSLQDSKIILNDREYRLPLNLRVYKRGKPSIRSALKVGQTVEITHGSTNDRQTPVIEVIKIQ